MAPSKAKEHKHDWKYKGNNPKLPQFGGARMSGRLYACGLPGCNAIRVEGMGDRPASVTPTPQESAQ